MTDAKSNDFDETDQLCIKTIGVLAADMVEKAKSGHPGAPMGLNAVSHVLWTRFLNGNGKSPNWPNRDRFVLSNGHACALQYCMLHLNGYNVSMDDLQQFRQLDSVTPGHPECHMTDGVEVSTGPLGQGIAQAVGLAIAGKHLAARFNEPDFPLFNSKVYVFCGDGCMMEGVASEAASLAGHLRLNNLILVYDDNNITIDGHTDLAFTERVPQRFESYGWRCLNVADGNTNIDGIHAALADAQTGDRPVLISVKTIIGYGCSKANTHGVHGAALGAESLAGYKTTQGFNPSETFAVDQSVYERYASTFLNRGGGAESEWTQLLAAYCQKFPEKGKLLSRLISNELPADMISSLPTYDETSKVNATRNISNEVLNAFAVLLPELIGGSADLTGSNKTALKGVSDFQAASYDGRYIRFGVREFAMFAIGNGISAFNVGLIPFTATFLNFITYGYGAVRLGALSHLRQIYIMTHDSIFLGEDGPTHQPVEVLPALRALPNFYTFRPCDGNEVNGSYLLAIGNRTAPSAICLTRQKVMPLGTTSPLKVQQGMYIVQAEEKQCDCVLIASGSEVGPCVEASKLLKAADIDVRVVSAPCLELFDAQSKEYKQSVLCDGSNNRLCISVEASSPYGWRQYSHSQICVPAFGKSAPLASVRKDFGFEPQQIADRVVQVQKMYSGVDVPLLACLYPN